MPVFSKLVSFFVVAPCLADAQKFRCHNEAHEKKFKLSNLFSPNYWFGTNTKLVTVNRGFWAMSDLWPDIKTKIGDDDLSYLRNHDHRIAIDPNALDEIRETLVQKRIEEAQPTIVWTNGELKADPSRLTACAWLEKVVDKVAARQVLGPFFIKAMKEKDGKRFDHLVQNFAMKQLAEQIQDFIRRNHIHSSTHIGQWIDQLNEIQKLKKYSKHNLAKYNAIKKEFLLKKEKLHDPALAKYYAIEEDFQKKTVFLREVKEVKKIERLQDEAFDLCSQTNGSEKDWKDCIKKYEEAVELDGNEYEHHHKLALLHERIGDLSKAWRVLAPLLRTEKFPENKEDIESMMAALHQKQIEKLKDFISELDGGEKAKLQKRLNEALSEGGYAVDRLFWKKQDAIKKQQLKREKRLEEEKKLQQQEKVKLQQQQDSHKKEETLTKKATAKDPKVESFSKFRQENINLLENLHFMFHVTSKTDKNGNKQYGFTWEKENIKSSENIRTLEKIKEKLRVFLEQYPKSDEQERHSDSSDVIEKFAMNWLAFKTMIDEFQQGNQRAWDELESWVPDDGNNCWQMIQNGIFDQDCSDTIEKWEKAFEKLFKKTIVHLSETKQQDTEMQKFLVEQINFLTTEFGRTHVNENVLRAIKNQFLALEQENKDLIESLEKEIIGNDPRFHKAKQTLSGFELTKKGYEQVHKEMKEQEQ